jgi:hypothetical protein
VVHRAGTVAGGEGGLTQCPLQLALARSGQRVLPACQGTFGIIQTTCSVIQGTFGAIQGTFGIIQATCSVIQGTFGAIQGTFGIIQGTFGVIQATCSVIQGTFGAIQGTFGVIQGTFGAVACGEGGLAQRPLQLALTHHGERVLPAWTVFFFIF